MLPGGGKAVLLAGLVLAAVLAGCAAPGPGRGADIRSDALEAVDAPTVPAQPPSAAETASPDPGPPQTTVADNGSEALPPVAAPAPVADLWHAAPGLHPVRLTVEGEPADGLFAVPPSGTSTTLLVVMKGWHNTLDQVAPLLQAVSDRGALAVAMEFRGPVDAWKVDAAAEDTVAATLALRAAHPEVERVVLFGFSMGGSASGMAVAQAPPGTFTHWVTGAGVMDLNATWREEPTMQPLIEDATGGTPVDVPAEFAKRSPIDLVPAIAAAGLHRVRLVHGAGDTIVPWSHEELMYHALADAGVPATAYTVLTGNGTWVCVLIVVCPAALPVGPASHEASYFGYLQTVLWETLAADPAGEPRALHYAVDGVTGAKVRLPD